MSGHLNRLCQRAFPHGASTAATSAPAKSIWRKTCQKGGGRWSVLCLAVHAATTGVLEGHQDPLPEQKQTPRPFRAEAFVYARAESIRPSPAHLISMKRTGCAGTASVSVPAAATSTPAYLVIKATAPTGKAEAVIWLSHFGQAIFAATSATGAVHACAGSRMKADDT